MYLSWPRAFILAILVQELSALDISFTTFNIWMNFHLYNIYRRLRGYILWTRNATLAIPDLELSTLDKS